MSSQMRKATSLNERKRTDGSGKTGASNAYPVKWVKLSNSDDQSSEYLVPGTHQNTIYRLLKGRDQKETVVGSLPKGDLMRRGGSWEILTDPEGRADWKDFKAEEFDPQAVNAIIANFGSTGGEISIYIGKIFYSQTRQVEIGKIVWVGGNIIYGFRNENGESVDLNQENISVAVLCDKK